MVNLNVQVVLHNRYLVPSINPLFAFLNLCFHDCSCYCTITSFLRSTSLAGSRHKDGTVVVCKCNAWFNFEISEGKLNILNG